MKRDELVDEFGLILCDDARSRLDGVEPPRSERRGEVGERVREFFFQGFVVICGDDGVVSCEAQQAAQLAIRRGLLAPQSARSGVARVDEGRLGLGDARSAQPVKVLRSQVDLAADLDAYRFLTWRAAVLRDRGERCGTESAMAKSCTSRLANRAARAAVSILGQRGASGATAAERLLRDARITEIYEGATDIQRLVIARGLLA